MGKTAITLETWLAKARAATARTNPKAPEQIIGKVLKLSPTQIAAQSHKIKLSTKNKFKLDNLLARLLAGRSLAAVLGNTHFHNVSLKVNKHSLAPRAETEVLVEYAINNIPKNSQALDIGTGTGAIGLSLAKARPDLKITLTDINSRVLNLAKINARKNKITTVSFEKDSLIKKIDQSQLASSFFLANLPYVNPNWASLKHKHLKHEPRSTLFAADNGLQLIKNLLDQLTSKNLLTKDNWILLEHDPKQYNDLQKYCKKLSLTTKPVSDFVTLVCLA